MGWSVDPLLPLADEKKDIFFPFFGIAFAWSWVFWLTLAFISAGLLPGGNEFLAGWTMPLSILAAFGPGIAAMACLRAFHVKGALRQYLRSLLDFRFGWTCWFAPILVLGTITALSWILPEFWGEPRLPILLPSVSVFPLYLLLMILFGGGQEELGWRGYILEPMEARFGAWRGNLILGVLWAVWHLPLFFIAGTGQTYMNFAGFLLVTIGLAYIFAWVRQVSGKRPLAALIAHGWSNAFLPLFPILILQTGVAQPRYWMYAVITFLTGLVTMALRDRKLI
jgi:hypothetical protein